MSYFIASLLCAYAVGIITGVFLEYKQFERHNNRNRGKKL